MANYSIEPDDAQSRFRQAYREYYPALMQYLRHRLGNEADAADIAQEAYIRLLRYPEDQGPAALKALLFRIATNLVLMRARAARTHHQLDHVPLEEDLSLVAPDPPVERQVASQQHLTLLLRAIQKLPRKRQQVFILSRIHELSYPEVAARCGISVKMVEKHMKKALAACRELVGG